MAADRLAKVLVGGVLKHELDLPKTSSLLLEYLDDDDFLLPPLPNHLFQRDNSAWVYDGLTVNPMSKLARKRETINSRLIWNFHPMFRDPPHFYYGNDSENHDPANCEGGDILVIGNGTVMVGMGERTSPRASSSSPGVLQARQGHQGHRGRAAQDPLVHAPRHRDDDDRRDAFSVYPHLRVAPLVPLTPIGTGGDYQVTENAELFPVVAGPRRREGP